MSKIKEIKEEIRHAASTLHVQLVVTLRFPLGDTRRASDRLAIFNGIIF